MEPSKEARKVAHNVVHAEHVHGIHAAALIIQQYGDKRVAEAEAQKWQPIETAPKDGAPFLATTMVSHIEGSSWRETHLIYCDDETGAIHPDCEQGWEIDDYTLWCPVPTIPATAIERREHTTAQSAKETG